MSMAKQKFIYKYTDKYEKEMMIIIKMLSDKKIQQVLISALKIKIYIILSSNINIIHNFYVKYSCTLLFVLIQNTWVCFNYINLIFI